jgi:hypothetical protein
MLTALTVFVLAAGGFVLIMLIVVVVVMRQEPRGTALGAMAPTPIAATVRRMLGVGVRRPDVPADAASRQCGRWPDR